MDPVSRLEKGVAVMSEAVDNEHGHQRIDKNKNGEEIPSGERECSNLRNPKRIGDALA